MTAALALAPVGALAQQSGSLQASQRQVDQGKPTACTSDPTALAGVVTDNQGALVVGADVTLRLQGQLVGSIKSDQAGCFQFAVASGNYEIEVDAQGFAPTSKAVSFGNALPTLTEMSLQLGVQVRVQVTATNPASYSLTGAMAITYKHWYQRFGYRLRHPVAYVKYKLNPSHS